MISPKPGYPWQCLQAEGPDTVSPLEVPPLMGRVARGGGAGAEWGSQHERREESGRR